MRENLYHNAEDSSVDIMPSEMVFGDYVPTDESEAIIATQVDDIFASFEKQSLANLQTGTFETVDDAMEAFDDGLNRAILKDEEAFTIISQAMDYMRTSGEFDRVAQLAMTLGAMACMHDHMRDFANTASGHLGDIFGNKADLDENGHNHDHGLDHDHEEDDDENDGKKKKKRYWWQ